MNTLHCANWKKKTIKSVSLNVITARGQCVDDCYFQPVCNDRQANLFIEVLLFVNNFVLWLLCLSIRWWFDSQLLVSVMFTDCMLDKCVCDSWKIKRLLFLFDYNSQHLDKSWTPRELPNRYFVNMFIQKKKSTLRKVLSKICKSCFYWCKIIIIKN